jgi:hypothetical protein
MTIATQQFGAINLGYYGPSVDGWNTGGVSGGQDGTFVNPDANLPYGFLQFGSRMVTGGVSDVGAFLVAAVDGSSVVPSTGWTQIWNTEGVSGGENGYLYEPIAPPGYVALGVTFTNNGQPNFHVACVSANNAVASPESQIWSTAGISGGANLTLYAAIIDPTAFPPTPGATSIIPMLTTAFVASTDAVSVPAYLLQQFSAL